MHQVVPSSTRGGIGVDEGEYHGSIAAREKKNTRKELKQNLASPATDLFYTRGAPPPPLSRFDFHLHISFLRDLSRRPAQSAMTTGSPGVFGEKRATFFSWRGRGGRRETVGCEGRGIGCEVGEVRLLGESRFRCRREPHAVRPECQEREVEM